MPTPLPPGWESIELERVAPRSAAEVADLMTVAATKGQAVYPVGGGLGLSQGTAPTSPGVLLETTTLDQVVDYPARDMTITLGAGATMSQMAQTLSAEGQHLPIDAASPDRATIGGVVAAAASGPRRFGRGTIRDYVIGVEAVDGTGRLFHGGGRVVKNVAGYDFCKLLTGSLGLLGVVTQVTLKTSPSPAARRWVVRGCEDAGEIDRLVASLLTASVRPVAVEAWRGAATKDWASGSSAWSLAALVEGTVAEVDWSTEELKRTWADGEVATIDDADGRGLLRRIADFEVEVDSPLVVKLAVLPSRLAGVLSEVLAVDPHCSLSARAADGVAWCALSRFDDGLLNDWVKRIQPAAIAASGSAVVLRCDSADLTPIARWGPSPEGLRWMREVKAKLDPDGRLNPGRYFL